MSVQEELAGRSTAGTSDTSGWLSEFAARPTAVIVHDPVAVGAFDALDEVESAEELHHAYLFRERPSTRVFQAQHRAFVETLERLVPNVLYLHDLVGEDERFAFARGNPNQVYTRDALITIPWVPDGFIPGQMKSPIRRTESLAMVAAARSLGLREITRVPEGFYLEGGDVIPFVREGRRALLIGFGRRTRLETVELLCELLMPQYIDEIFAIELAQWRINLDGGMVPVAPDVVVCHRPSLLRCLHFGSNAPRFR